MRPSLAWCIPQYGTFEVEVYKNHLAAISNASRIFDVKIVGVTDKMYLHSASNALVDGALKENVDYIFWTESDMLLPYNAIEQLYKHDKEICGGLYFLRGCGYIPCLYRHNDFVHKSKYSHTPVVMFKENDLMKVDCCGMGCVLFQTDVFRKLEQPWFDLKEKEYGQDIYFYTKIREAKIEVWVDTGVQCKQLAARNITSIEDYKKHLADITARFNSGFLSNIKEEQK